MNILFLDTSSSKLTVAIVKDDRVLIENSYFSNNEHSKNALVELEKTFNQCGLEPNQIDKIMVVNGPGSFTGIRIGVTIAKVYAWTLNKQVIPISSLKAAAISMNDNYDYYISAIDARRNSVYTGIYDSHYNTVVEENYMAIDKLNNLINNLQGQALVTGDININDKYETVPIKLDVLKIVKYYKDNIGIPVHQLNPNYLKRVEAEERLMGVIE